MVVLLLLALLAAPARADTESDARPVVEAAQADTLARNLGRYMLRTRWKELLDEVMYGIAPKGAWSPQHPAWAPARDALAMAIRRESMGRLDGDAGRMLREVVRERYSSLSPDERARTIAFYESPGGRSFLDTRQKHLAARAYGMPYGLEDEPRVAYQRAANVASKTLRHLPVQQTQAVYDFTNSPLGEQLQHMENGPIADVAQNILRSDLDGVLIEHGAAIADAVRAAVPGVPARSEKTYLGTVTMTQDRTLDVVVEYHEMFRIIGTYRFSYRPDGLHWSDIAAAVPGIAPGETRSVYREPRGRLSDTP